MFMKICLEISEENKTHKKASKLLVRSGPVINTQFQHMSQTRPGFDQLSSSGKY